MKVYVIYDPLHEKIICVHSLPNVECEKCIDIRNSREEDKDNYYFLEEIERDVYEPDVKTYDSPAVLNYYSDEEANQRREEHICSADEEDTQPQYLNPKTGKSQKLFDVLNKVYMVRYKDHEVGYKGEALYICLEAENETKAISKAIENQEFLKHIDMGYVKLKYLHAYEATGNYVIGKVEYYEGDPRL